MKKTMTKQNLEKEYCNERGDSSFNDYNNNDYTKWLETKLIETEKQLNLPGVSQRSELLPEFLMHDLDGKIITSVIGSADVTKEWNEYLGNCG